jgi:hypothetical protein
MEQVLSIWGNSRQRDVTIVGEVLDGHFLGWRSLAVRKKRIDPETSRGQ